MVKTPSAKASKFAGPPFYICPECDAGFQCATPDDARRVRLHQILHVTDRKVRWQLLDEWRTRQALLAGSVVVD
jgi:hypothetical protein